MARNNGIIRLKGTVGGITFYKRLGVEVAREPAGPSADQIRKRKSMRRQRENINEFYHAASPAAKVLRTCLAPMKHLWHPDLSGKLNGLFRTIIDREPGVPGQRSLHVRAHKEMLKDFKFHPEKKFENIFSAAFHIEVNDRRNEAMLHVPSFAPETALDAPRGATCFRFLFAITVLSEYVFHKEASPYLPLDAEANGQHDFITSEYMDLQSTPPPLALKAGLPEGVAPAATSALVVALGVEFYQEVNGEIYLLRQGGGMKVAEVK